MEEIKQKFLALLNKQNAKIPSMGFSDVNYHLSQAPPLSINSKTAQETDRPADQDILEGIEAAYFSLSDTFDIRRFELSKLPAYLDCGHIQQDFKTLKQQHEVVSKKVLQLILEHQTMCRSEFEKIVEIKTVLTDALILCKESRNELHIAEKQFSSSLSILANHRKRRLYQNLLNNLNTIKTLHRTEHRLKELLSEEKYAGAIELLQECQAAANTYRHFTCVAALTNKLQETLEETEQKLDQVLAQMCFYFDVVRYSKLQAAYKLLGKTQIAMDHLHMHYASAIYSTALNIVRMHATTPSSTANDLDAITGNSEKKPYDKLCVSITPHVFIPCLVDLCKSLFKIITSYHQLGKWHGDVEAADDAHAEMEDAINREYVRQKLESGRGKIWHDVQSKVAVLLTNGDLSSYKFTQFVQVLGVVHRLMEVGEEFCGSKSDVLQQSIKQQSFAYFKCYHAQKLDELRIFLENEIWEICPVKATFDILQLHEFKSLRSVLRNFKVRTATTQACSVSPDCSSSTHSQDGSTTIGNYLLRYGDRGTPFDASLDETVNEEDILMAMGEAMGDAASGYCSEESDEEAEELRREFVDDRGDDPMTKELTIEKKQKHHAKSLILTNTTLTVLRQMGNYLQMSRLLQPIAFDIIQYMFQFFEFYMYTVHCFFASDLEVPAGALYTLRLNATLKRIEDSLYPDGRDIERPHMNPMVNLRKREQLHGLAERVTAVESLIFLSKQYETMEEYMEYLVPPNNKLIIQQFFNQTITSAVDLRKPVYMCVASQAFDLRQILIAMSKINWEIKEVMSQHNAYIDVLLREVQIFSMRLEQVSACVPLAVEVLQTLWESIAHIVTHTLVQGYSDARKCSNGGRALMQLDFTQFLTKFERISGLRPVPHKEYVENYVKAYYLPEVELEKWIREHTEYSSKHLLGLISCTCQNNKKSRQRLVQLIEEIEKNSR